MGWSACYEGTLCSIRVRIASTRSRPPFRRNACAGDTPSKISSGFANQCAAFDLSPNTSTARARTRSAVLPRTTPLPLAVGRGDWFSFCLSRIS